MKYKYLLIAFALSLCANAHAEWFLRGTHNAWAATQMESAGAGTNTMQLKGVVFAAAGSVKFDRFGNWAESYGVGGRSGSNIAVAAGTWDIKFFTDSKTWSITAPQVAATYHVRGTNNAWLEGTLLNRIGTSDAYELCVNFTAGDADGGPRFKIDPNGAWGDGIPVTDVLVTLGWVKISFNSVSKAISTQQSLAANCTAAVSSSSVTTPSSISSSSSKPAVTSSSLTSSSSIPSTGGAYHLRGTFNGWLEGTLMNRIGVTDTYERCVNFIAGDAAGSPRFKIDPNGAWGDGIPAADVLVSAGWVKISFNSVSKAITTQQNLAANCAAAVTSSSAISSSRVSSSSATSISSAPASIYHVRGTFNGWLEGTLMTRVGTTVNYELCANFIGGDANGNPRFKIDPNGAWGDGIPAADFMVTAGWVKILFNSTTKAITVQQNLPVSCGALSSSSAISSSSLAVASSSSISSSSSAVSSSSVFAGPTASKVFFQVDKAADYVILFVNDIERMRWAKSTGRSTTDINAHFIIPASARIGEKIDITHLMGQGVNDIKIVATAESWDQIIGAYDVKLWTDNNETPLFAAKNDAIHNFGAFAGIFLEKKLSINLPNAAPRRRLWVNATNDEEAIYINNVFTGKKAPAFFDLPQGEYRLGIGKSSSNLLPNGKSIFTGEFHEKDLVVFKNDIVASSANIPEVTKVNELKVAVIPYREVHYSPTEDKARLNESVAATDIGIMTDDDILVAKKGIEETSTKYLLPLSYGLTKWNITLLPTITDRIYYVGGYAGVMYKNFADGAFDRNAIQFGQNLAQYDIVIHLRPDRTQQRVVIANSIPGVAWSGAHFTWLPIRWAMTNAEDGSLAERLSAVSPSHGLLHETLHNRDFNRWNDINGVDQLHGGEEHGYDSCVGEWTCFFRDYIRSQVAEDVLTTKRPDSQTTYTPPPKPTPEATTLYTGLFNAMHSGKGIEQLWSFSKPLSQLQNLGNLACMDVSYASQENDAAISAWGCNVADLNQQFSLKHVQNGAYQMVAEHSQKCVEFSSDKLFQNTCGVKVEQRFLLGNTVNGSFAIKSLNGKCLALVDTAMFMEVCDASRAQQQWRFILIP